MVKEGVEGNEVGDRGKAYATNISNGKGSNYPICTFISPSIPQYHSAAENVNVMLEPIIYRTTKL